MCSGKIVKAVTSMALSPITTPINFVKDVVTGENIGTAVRNTIRDPFKKAVDVPVSFMGEGPKKSIRPLSPEEVAAANATPPSPAEEAAKAAAQQVTTMQDASKDYKTSVKNKRGLSSTILTTPLGVPGKARTTKKSLLGQ